MNWSYFDGSPQKLTATITDVVAAAQNSTTCLKYPDPSQELLGNQVRSYDGHLYVMVETFS